MEGLTVIIPTYNRPDILRETIMYLEKNLYYDGPIEYLVGNDGDIGNVPDFHMPHYKVVEGPKTGHLGANLNYLIETARTELLLQMDDDHHLVKELDINQFAKDLINYKNEVGWIRLFLGTEEDLNNDDPFYNFKARMHERYWYPFPYAGEMYIASNRPHIKHKRFHRHYGLYANDLKLGQTEVDFCARYNDNWKLESCPRVVIPVAMPSFDTWKHVGDSWQKKGF